MIVLGGLIVGAAIAGFLLRRVGVVVVGALVIAAVLLSVFSAVSTADLHVEGLGILFVMAEIALVTAVGAGVGVLARRRIARRTEC